MKRNTSRTEANTRKGHATLLEKAFSYNSRTDKNDISDEHIELALAWAKDRISYSQAKEALIGDKSDNIYPILARALRAYFQKENL